MARVANGGATTERHYKIMRMARKGLSPCEIAPRLKTTPNAIRLIISRLRAKGYDVPKGDPTARTPSAKIDLPRRIPRGLLREAKARGLSTRELAAAIIAGAVRKNLIEELVDK